jgi:hypothetical protein
MNSKIKVALFFSFALLTAAPIIPAFIPDQEYTPGAQVWFDDANTVVAIPANDNRFNALVGFFVDEDKDSIMEGVKLIEEANKLLNDTDTVQGVADELNSYWQSPPLVISLRFSQEQIDNIENDPVLWIHNNNGLLETSISENQTLLKRYDHFIGMTQYSDSLKLDIRRPIPSYENLISVKRLNNLSIIHDYLNGNAESTEDLLQNNLDSSKLMLLQARTFSEKMVAVKFLTMDLNTISNLQNELDYNSHLNFDMANINAEERSLVNVFKAQFASHTSHLTVANLTSNDESISEHIENSFIKAYLKPKGIGNRDHNQLLEALKLEHMPMSERRLQHDFNLDTYTFNLDNYSLWEKYQDPVGYVVAWTARPSYLHFMDTIDHLDGLVTLVNIKRTIYSQSMNTAEIDQYISNLDPGMNSGYSGAKIIIKNEGENAGTILTFSIPDYTEDIPSVKLI